MKSKVNICFFLGFLMMSRKSWPFLLWIFFTNIILFLIGRKMALTDCSGPVLKIFAVVVHFCIVEDCDVYHSETSFFPPAQGSSWVTQGSSWVIQESAWITMGTPWITQVSPQVTQGSDSRLYQGHRSE